MIFNARKTATTPMNWLLIIMIVGGIGFTYIASQNIRQNAETSWESKLNAEANRLTEVFIGWHQRTAIPLQSLGTLFNHSSRITETEFWGAIYQLEDYNAESVPVFLSYATPIGAPLTKGKTNSWSITFSTDPDGVFRKQVRIPEGFLLDTINAANHNPNVVVLGPSFADENEEPITILALSAPNNKINGVLLAVMSYQEMIEALFELEMPTGFDLHLSKRSADLKKYQEIQNIWEATDIAEPNQRTITLRSTVFRSEYLMDWVVNLDEYGESKSQLANVVLISGIATIGLITILLGFLMMQNERVSRQVERRTLALKNSEIELSEKSRHVELLHDVTSIANNADDFETAIQSVLDLLCNFNQWPIGHAFKLSEGDTKMLVSMQLWHLEVHEKFEEFRRSAEKMTFLEGVGLPGRALKNKQVIWISDLSDEKNFPKAAMIKNVNLISGFAFPVMDDSRVIAVLEFFTDQRDQPEELFLESLEHIGMELGKVYSRVQVKNELLKAHEQAQAVTEELREANFLSDTALDLTKAGFWYVDFLNDPDYYIASEQVRDMFGDPQKEDNRYHLMDHWFVQVKAGDEAASEVALDNFQGALAGRYPRYDATFAYKRPLDGQIMWAHGIGIITRNDAGEPMGMHGVVQDITESRTLESNLRTARDAAEAATEAKANFLAAMSHEIRTPMNGIIGMVDLLRQSDLKPDHKNMLQTISDSGQSLLTIINDILDFSKIEAGKLELEFIPFSILDLVESCAETVKLLTISKGLQMFVYVDPNIPASVVGDPVRIRQILMNLIGNAIKFTNKGTVEIRAERVAHSNTSDLTIRFSLIDSGIGISEEAQANLFQAFSQAESSTTRKYGGTGLGLSISQRLTELMGGKIEVESNLGTGSVFSAALPFTEADVPLSTTLMESTTDNLNGINVLIVSNEEKEATICRNYLEHWQAEVRLLRELEQLVAHFKENAQPEIILLGSCWEREQQIKFRDTFAKDPQLKNIHFVMLMTGKRNSPRLDDAATVILDVGPLRRVTFLTAIAIAAGRASPEIFYEEEVENINNVQAPTVEEARRNNELILVAEDNMTNQDVINRQLNMLGYTCIMADDGQLALEEWLAQDFALLLTDCHMPNMDGFGLVDAIRQDEKGNDKIRKPIVAITANALQGEAERCIAAGMDDYMSKPIDMKILKEKLRKWLPHALKSQAKTLNIPVPIRQTEDNDCPIDPSALTAMFGDDPDLHKEILNDFLEPSRNIITEIKTGWEKRSAEAVKQASHKLKSSAKSVGATNLADLCATLEVAGKEDDWETIDSGAPDLDQLMEKVEQHIIKL
jgi:signal transduction histidine kinase/CheY-like chemotaxis protein/HPt (histidine-containing phosphotransfer) domain-containing protein